MAESVSGGTRNTILSLVLEAALSVGETDSIIKEIVDFALLADSIGIRFAALISELTTKVFGQEVHADALAALSISSVEGAVGDCWDTPSADVGRVPSRASFACPVGVQFDTFIRSLTNPSRELEPIITSRACSICYCLAVRESAFSRVQGVPNLAGFAASSIKIRAALNSAGSVIKSEGISAFDALAVGIDASSLDWKAGVPTGTHIERGSTRLTTVSVILNTVVY